MTRLDLPGGSRLGAIAGLIGTFLTVGCWLGADLPPFPAKLARPEAGDVVLVEDNVIVFDASGSIDRKLDFPDSKAVLQSYLAGMPPGTYRVALRVLGGREDAQLELQALDRFELVRHAEELSWTGRETPLAAVLSEYLEPFADRHGRAAVVVFSDGVPTRHGRYVGPEETLEAARRLMAKRPGELCYHTVQVGADPRGQALLTSLAALSDCGSYRVLDDIDGAEALYAFQQQIYNGPPPPAPKRARAVTDLDHDGVDDRFDQCARTPAGARVDDRGCWVIEDWVFAHDSARILPEQETALAQVVEVLAANPELRVRLDGHTDAVGAARYNFDLGERRARSVAAYLSSHGIETSRLEVRSLGPTRPIAPNDTAEGRSRNRRVELRIIGR